MEYRREDLLRLAKRHHNTKRTYLLINPLQAKHMPVSPTLSLAMMDRLGEKLAAAYPETGLVIGFAETATAVAAEVARHLGPDCRYIHTTREQYAMAGEGISFQEEHSHATDQFLRTERLAAWIKDAKAIALVDDELSTGKTLLNILAQLREAFPAMRGKKVIAVSILNRMDEEHLALLESQSVHFLSLLKLPQEDYMQAVASFEIIGAEPPSRGAWISVDCQTLAPSTPDPRIGAKVSSYFNALESTADKVFRQYASSLRDQRVLVLGTEESMAQSLIFGKRLEDSGIALSVSCHATTRSPIGICSAENYPIRSGVLLHSFYEEDRKTYLYNLAPYDTAFVFTDAPELSETALRDLRNALALWGCGRLILVREGKHV